MNDSRININIGSGVGTSAIGALYIVLIVLKIVGVAPLVATSWWWLILWPLALTVSVLVLLCLVLAGLAVFLK